MTHWNIDNTEEIVKAESDINGYRAAIECDDETARDLAGQLVYKDGVIIDRHFAENLRDTLRSIRHNGAADGLTKALVEANNARKRVEANTARRREA